MATMHLSLQLAYVVMRSQRTGCTKRLLLFITNTDYRICEATFAWNLMSNSGQVHAPLILQRNLEGGALAGQTAESILRKTLPSWHGHHQLQDVN